MKTYRNLFFDYHMSSTVTNIAVDFNAEQWALALEEAHVESVSAFCRCGHGYRYYQKGEKGTLHPHLPEGVDMVEETIRACHKRGIKVIGYCHVWGAEAQCLKVEDVFKVREDGTWRPQNPELCPNNPFYEDDVIDQFREIVANYDLDAMFFDGAFTERGRECYCKHCQNKFTADTGIVGIPRSMEDEHYETYLHWRESDYKKLRQRIFDAVHQIKPDMPITINWQNIVRSPEKATDEVGFFSQDAFPANFIATAQTQSKMWASTGKPFAIMSHMCPQWWLGYDVKPLASIIQEMMVSVIDGGKAWIGFNLYQDYSVAPLVMRQIKDAFAYLKDIEEVFRDKELFPYIGVLCDEAQISSSRVKNKPFSPFVDEISMLGLNKVLTTSQIPYNIMQEKEMLDRLDDLKLVIIANNQPISETFYTHLKDYVAKGGNLLIAGKSGSVTLDGQLVQNKNFEELTGVVIEREAAHPYAYVKACDTMLDEDEDHMPILCAEPFVYVKPTDAKSYARIVNPYFKSTDEIQWQEYTCFSAPFDDTGYDAITMNQYGKGKVLYFASDFFRGYVGTNNWRMKTLIRNAINKLLLGESALRSNAPAVIEMTVLKGVNEDTLLVNFLNTMREVPMREVKTRYENAICEDILPVYGIDVDFPMAVRPKSLWLVSNKEYLNYTYEEGILFFRVPKVEIYEGIVIDF